MLFYNGTLVNWKDPSTEIEKEVSRTITELRSEHFGEDKKGFCQLRYPNGIRVKNKSGLYEPKKKFYLDLVSFDGQWRWSDSMPREGRFHYRNTNHFPIQDPYLFEERDLDLVWYLKNHCPEVRSKRVYFEDFEASAKKEAQDMVSDIDIKHALYSNKSPLVNDMKTLREVADVFNVEDVKRLGRYELKNALYRVVVAGEKSGSKYVNFERFDELTDNSAKLRAAFVVKKAINNGTLKFHAKERAWYSYFGNEYVEKLIALKPTQLNDKNGVLLEKVLDDKIFKGKVFAELGITGYETRAEVEELGYHNIVKMCKQEGIAVEKGDKLENVVEKYCNHMDIES